MDAVVTAGGRIGGAFATRTGVTVKALLEVAGRPVISTVIEALRGLPEIERIVVVGPEEVLRSAAADKADEIIPEAESGAVNFIMGLERCAPGEKAVFAASDLPFLTTSAVRAFLDLCPLDGEFCYPVLTRAQFLSAYPGSTAKFAPLKGGWYTGGCVFLVDPQPLLANRELIERVFAARKSLTRLAAILGWSFVLRLITMSADVEACVRRGSEVIGCNCRAVMDSPPELAFDLDDLNDYECALRLAARVSA